MIFQKFLKERVMETEELKVFCELERWNSLEHLKIFEVKKKRVPSRLYIEGENEWEYAHSKF